MDEPTQLYDLPRDAFVYGMALRPTQRAALCCTCKALRYTLGRREGERPLIWPGQALFQAAADDHLVRVRQLLEPGRLPVRVLRTAVRNRALTVLDALATPADRERLFFTALLSGHHDLRDKWMPLAVPYPPDFDSGFPYEMRLRAHIGAWPRVSNVLLALIQHDCLEQLQWLEDTYLPHGELRQLMSLEVHYAARHNHLPALQWILEAKTKWGHSRNFSRYSDNASYAMTMALMRGHHEAARLIAQAVPGTLPDCCVLCLSRLVPNPAFVVQEPWAKAVDETLRSDRAVGQALASSGQLARIKTLTTAGVLWTWLDGVAQGALQRGHLEILDWVLDHVGAYRVQDLLRCYWQRTFTYRWRSYKPNRRTLARLWHWAWRHWQWSPYFVRYGSRIPEEQLLLEWK